MLRLSLGAVLVSACTFAPTGLSPTLGDDDDDDDVPVDARAVDAIAIDSMPGCLDDDDDDVCNQDDDCQGHDDRLDVDGDGTPDGCDDWSCGATRPSVTLPVTIEGGLTIREVSIDGGGAVEELGRNANAVVGVRYTCVDDNRGPQDKLELGVADGIRLSCRRPSDQILGWTAPPIGFNTGGSHRVVSLTAQVAHENNCSSGDREDGWADAAPDEPIIGVICVR